MGDILGAIFGGGKSQTQVQTPDEQAQRLNRLKADELERLFQSISSTEFTGAAPGLFSLSPESMELVRNVTGGQNRLNLQQYMDMFKGEAGSYLSKIISPEIMNQASLSGLARGGAPLEALAKAGASIALPFMQSLPGAVGQMIGNQQSMLNISDLSRQLAVQDFLRRQGLVTSAMTGIPFNPGAASKGRERSQPLFNFFGQG